MNKVLVWTGVVICIAGVLLYAFTILASPALWLVLAGVGLLLAVFGVYYRPTTTKTKK